MNAINATSWEDFEQQLTELRAKHGSESYPLLFRGQGNSEWPLTTTLDRNTKNPMTFSDYYQMITGGVGPEVKTFSSVEAPQWSVDIAPNFSNEGLLLTVPRRFPDEKLYPYMVYLRHFGFPSPLLDWSRSPYVAAFFAFRDPLVNVGRHVRPEMIDGRRTECYSQLTLAKRENRPLFGLHFFAYRRALRVASHFAIIQSVRRFAHSRNGVA